MIVTVVTVYVKDEHIDDFIKASMENHQNSVKEPGNLRFDVLQCSTDPTRFTLYEAYETEAAAAAHKNSSHYVKWRVLVAPWMKKPREGIAHSVIMPLDKSLWK
jgi:(4S)-4-hydroxy-5-phosphonooxypentane-2,3-dione isomerase